MLGKRSSYRKTILNNQPQSPSPFILPGTVVHPPVELKDGVVVIPDDVELTIYKGLNPYPHPKVTILKGGAYQAA